MSIYADCRVDKYYNQDFLGELDRQYIAGFDMATSIIKGLFQDNLFTYKDDLEYDGDLDLYKVLEKAKDEITDMIDDWTENGRDTMIIAMIEDMDYEEYKINRKKALREAEKNGKKYEDTESWSYLTREPGL